MFSCGTVGDNNTSVGMVSMSAKPGGQSLQLKSSIVCAATCLRSCIYMYAFMCVRVCVCPQNGGKK